MDDLISRKAAIAEIEEYIEEYSELDENGYHSLKWCAMKEAKETLSMLPAVDAVPVEWLKEKMLNRCTTDSNPFGYVLSEWLDEQEA